MVTMSYNFGSFTMNIDYYYYCEYVAVHMSALFYYKLEIYCLHPKIKLSDKNAIADAFQLSIEIAQYTTSEHFRMEL